MHGETVVRWRHLVNGVTRHLVADKTVEVALLLSPGMGLALPSVYGITGSGRIVWFGLDRFFYCFGKGSLKLLHIGLRSNLV